VGLLYEKRDFGPNLSVGGRYMRREKYRWAGPSRVYV
jgi:hypothetical protein